MRITGIVATIERNAALSDDQRSEVNLYIAEIDKRIAERDGRRVAEAISILVLSTSNRNLDAATSAGIVGGFIIALEDAPPWAVELAAARWLRADLAGTRLEAANLAFPPTPPQLRQVVNHVMHPLRSQLWQLKRLMSAEVEEEYTDEYRYLMLQRLAVVIRSIRAERSINSAEV
jgi:hypothetical protein